MLPLIAVQMYVQRVVQPDFTQYHGELLSQEHSALSTLTWTSRACIFSIQSTIYGLCTDRSSAYPRVIIVCYFVLVPVLEPAA
jgi:hypothetical protein